jgi:hypothetical protein
VDPIEASSPRGSRFQERDAPRAWDDPAGFHAAARACGSGAPPHPWAGAGRRARRSRARRLLLGIKLLRRRTM